MHDGTPPALVPEGGLQAETARTLKTLIKTRQQLEAAVDKMDPDEDDAAAKEIAALGRKLAEALAYAYETERRYNEWVAKQAGDGTAGELDLADIRTQVGCRLARLRSCCTGG
ncbi:hypothetical protein [Pseudoroseicyclus tamaricis]|uniref:Uncharacterized protein n=1 Tax=Pseudoroseicyclus tamaricis TaxID=2705421 RepID=A0A6B2JW14_9RHOB|nr:hypothetical protein [Pseudoroseicyclus tamaricis]NDV00839.1 hypothetical protein [Pseudoroseicyclus tamaricis]